MCGSMEQTDKGKDRRKRRILIAAVILYFAVAFFTKHALAPEPASADSLPPPGDVSEGVEKIQLLSQRSVEETEETLKRMEKAERAEQIQAGNFNVIFEDAVFMGDSHLEGLSAYGLLDSAKVAAVKGRSLITGRKEIEKAAAQKPSDIFLNYGMNDVEIFGSNAQKYIETYRSFIAELKARVPDARIFICSIFVPQPQAVEKEPYLAYIPAYNEALKEFCSREGFTFIDTTGLLTDQYYEPDHKHTVYAYHRIWLSYVASEAGFVDGENRGEEG